jgi:hypothetical protein
VDSTRPPKDEEFELSIFGPGFGECLVIHLGFGKWMVIDSCMASKKKHSIAVEYLETLGVQIESQVELLVLTHWHADHIRGAANLFRRAVNAKLICSGALRFKEFFQLLAIAGESKLVSADNAAGEFRELLEIKKSRAANSQQAKPPGPDTWAQEGSPIFECKETRLFVRALSPSSQTLTDAASNFLKLLPSESQPVLEVPYVTPNDQSIAIEIVSPNVMVLLGADLENTTDKGRGWNAVLDYQFRHDGVHAVFKIPHHCSENAHNSGVWTKMLAPDAIAAITPFKNGKVSLPTETDVARTKALTSNAFISSWPVTRAADTRSSGVQRTIREVAIAFESLPKQPGQIRIRTNLTSKELPRVELFGSAKAL